MPNRLMRSFFIAAALTATAVTAIEPMMTQHASAAIWSRKYSPWMKRYKSPFKKDINQIINTAKPVKDAKKDLERACLQKFPRGVFQNPALKSAVSKFNKAQQACEGGIVTSCLTRAMKGKPVQLAVLNPKPIINRTAGCIRNTADDVANATKMLEREAGRLASDLANEAKQQSEAAARAALQQAEEVKKRLEEEARAKAEEVKRAAEEAERKAAEAKREAERIAAEAKRQAEQRAAELKRQAEREAAERAAAIKREAERKAAEVRRQAEEAKRRVEQEAKRAARKMKFW